ncbi:membrane protein [Mangrovimonas yunxiaonensis]|uniref:Membrane protein n=1 Tax=Mangrovimonas yunxiaonensis TaxID=1197477 RepID=A0A084TLF5_9FLAO|nr:zinc metallopeptidase [Mangrovimonas yunxiaonensis]KFB01541.1 membrane protein [Mangrovimonas yunxiaonensis]GGH36077.1 membrane protein [Mangrovimonas yunxiaonensis]
MIGYYILIGGIALVSWLVSNQLKQKFKKYSQVHLRNGMSGKEIAEKMLADNGIRDVEVISTPGQLTDHYNPKNKTVNLSESVYNERNAAAAAVAAHECGHAVQHAQAYGALQMRSALVPIVSVTSGMSQWLIIGGLVLGAAAGVGLGFWVALAGLAFMGAATLFSFITLPVEYDASNRALAWLKAKNMVTPEEYIGAEDALKWAARTYLVAAIGALASLLYWALQVFGGRD